MINNVRERPGVFVVITNAFIAMGVAGGLIAALSGVEKLILGYEFK